MGKKDEEAAEFVEVDVAEVDAGADVQG